jgi:3'-5' exoribonuclease
MQEKGYQLNALPATGEVTFLALAVEKELKPKRAGGLFLHVKLADRTGELDAKAWDCPEEVSQTFAPGDVVKVRGTLERYNDRPQLIIGRIRRCVDGEYDERDYWPASTRDPEEMYGQLLAFIEMVGRDALRTLLRSIVSDPAVAPKLKVAPAAMKVHHAFRSGLLEHITSLCDLAVMLSGKYERLDLDLLIAGAILHDLAKVECLETVGVGFAYTREGLLVDHVGLGLLMLERHCNLVGDFPAELKAVLQHLVISHHGDLDKGALRLPMLPEAQALHFMDMLDARMEQMFRLINQDTGTGEFTAYVPSLSRQLFRGLSEQEEKCGGQTAVAEVASE